MYRKTLENQWRNLCADFAQEWDRLALRGNAPKAFDEWYATRVRRWSSVAYSESVILGQLENEAFSRELRKAMADFRFTRVDPAAEKPIWRGFVIGGGIGALSGVGLAGSRCSQAI